MDRAVQAAEDALKEEMMKIDSLTPEVVRRVLPFLVPPPPHIQRIIRAKRQRDERRIRRFIELGLPGDVDDRTLAEQLGHHEMIPVFFSW